MIELVSWMGIYLGVLWEWDECCQVRRRWA